MQDAHGILAAGLPSLAGTLGGASDLTALVYRSAPGTASIELSARRVARLAGLDPEGPATELAGACVLGPGVLERLITDGRLELDSLDVLAAAELLAADEAAPVGGASRGLARAPRRRHEAVGDQPSSAGPGCDAVA